MVTINLNLSGSAFYKFTDPVRKFKANDPYYYEVDNIPVKQLEENILWLKDAVQNATIEVDQAQTTIGGGGSRSTFTELQPFLSGTNNNIVSVRPGRFIGRINDAYDLTPLQIFQRVNPNPDIGEFPEWHVAAIDNILLAPTLNKFKSLLAINSLGMNGLAERSFGSFIMRGLHQVGATGPNGSAPVYSLFGIFGSNPNFTNPSFLWGGSPRIDVTLPESNARDSGLSISPYKEENVGQTGAGFGFFHLYHADTQFVKRWRGVARTAVVDVPENLSIEVDRFYADDFSYYDEQELLIDESIPGSPAAQATQRIDLLFIYSKPIDSSAVHLNTSWTSEVPRKIYKAELGIVKGAGLTINYRTAAGIQSQFVTPNYQEAILAHYPDELNDNLGFKSLNIKGSFPSPDDLMNMSPALAEWLPRNHYALVGQSILPIAYIVVKKGPVNEVGNQVIEEEDIIDIRPFFRTTELTYGERAGLAAALPSPSLANPVATEGYVVYENNRVKTYINAQIDSLSAAVFDALNAYESSRAGGMGAVICRGIVRGGNYYGTEGSICRAIKYQYNFSGASRIEDTIAKFKELHNLPANYDFKNLPDWDLANWTYENITTNTTTAYPAIGFGVTDRFNHTYWGLASGNQYMFGHVDSASANADMDFGPFRFADDLMVAGRSNRMFGEDRVGVNVGPFGTDTGASGSCKRWFLTKTITLDITNTDWVQDITVIPNFWNCTPENFDANIFVSKGTRRTITAQGGAGQSASVRTLLDFTIFVFCRPMDSGYTTSRRVRVGTSYGNDPIYRTETTYATTYPSPLVMRAGGEALDGLFLSYSHAMHSKDNGDPWVSNRSRRQGYGGIGMPKVIYPSVEFTVIGHPRNFTGTTGTFFPNQMHKVPGIRDHESYSTNSRVDRPRLETSVRSPSNP